jgi:hypothetical protein
MSDRKVKLFLSHAWEDKEAIAQKLYEALKDKFDVWYDIESLQIGDSLTFKVGEGLKSCDYAIVVLSPTYLTKKWTRDEFVGLVNLETNERKILLPIWHNVTRDQVLEFSPFLADRVAGKSIEGIDVIVARIEGIVFGSQKTREIDDPLQKKFAEVADRFVLRDLNNKLSEDQKGVALVQAEVTRLFEIFWKRLDQVKDSVSIQKGPISPWKIRAFGRHRVTIEIWYENEWSNSTTDDTLGIQIFTPDDNYPSTYDQKKPLALRTFTSYFEPELVVWKTMVEGPEHGIIFGTSPKGGKLVSSEQVVDLALSLFVEELGSYGAES